MPPRVGQWDIWFVYALWLVLSVRAHKTAPLPILGTICLWDCTLLAFAYYTGKVLLVSGTRIDLMEYVVVFTN